MYNLASKILPLVLDPLLVAIVLLMCSFLVRNRRPRAFHLAYAFALILILLGACPTVEGWLLGSLERQYPDASADSYPSAQAIVVLGGTIHIPSRIHHASGIINPSDRLLVTLRLYHAGKAPLVISSGGNNPLFAEKGFGQSEGDVMRRLLVEWGLPNAAIEVEDSSINTRENALFSHRLLAGRGIVRIILVTSALHMPRAAAAFRKAGFDVVAAPADFETGWGAETTNPIFSWIPQAGALVGSSKAMREWLGLWVYRVHGWV